MFDQEASTSRHPDKVIANDYCFYQFYLTWIVWTEC